MADPAARKIVVIDDDDEMRGLIGHILRAGGYTVVDTGDPARAAELVRTEDPDLVLCDISMPGVDGYGVLQELQSDPATAGYPVVFLTAQREFTERVEAFRHGVVDYVAKPFTREILLRKVRKILEERAPRAVESPAVPATANGAAHDPPRLPGSAPHFSFDTLPEVVRDVLIVDDNEVFRKFLSSLLEHHGFTVHQAADGEEGLFLAQEYPVDLAIVDLGLPKLNGIAIVQRLRAEGRPLPILILTARGSWQDKVAGLEAGADDYLVKPFEYQELAARVKALLRRSLKSVTDVLVLGPLSIDLSGQVVRMGGEVLELTTFEYRMLEYLVRQRERVVTRQELSDYLYPHGDDRDSNVLEVLMGRLRRKLDPGGTLAPIETVRGRGYRFAIPRSGD